MVKVLLLNELTSMYGKIKVDLNLISTLQYMKYIQYTLTRFHIQSTVGSTIMDYGFIFWSV